MKFYRVIQARQTIPHTEKLSEIPQQRLVVISHTILKIGIKLT